MKKLIAICLLSLSLVSCMEVETPICDQTNLVDVFMPASSKVNYYDQAFEMVEGKYQIKRVKKGTYLVNGAEQILACEVAGKTIIQSKTAFNTYKIFSLSIGKDSFSMPEYVIDKSKLDDAGIPYRVEVRQNLDPRIENFVYTNSTQEVLVVKNIPKSLIPSLVSTAATVNFNY